MSTGAVGSSEPASMGFRSGGTSRRIVSYLRRVPLGLVSTVVVLALWYLLSSDGLHVIAPLKFPSPSQVVTSALTINTDFLVDVAYSMGRVLIGLFAGIVIGVAVGLLLSVYHPLYAFFNPLIEAVRPLPMMAALPFFELWFGLNELGKIGLIAFGTFMVMLISTIEAVRNVPTVYVQAAQTLGATPSQLYRTVVLPATLPELIPAVRVGTALSFNLVVAAEYMGAQQGLGYMIMNARIMLQTSTLLLGVVTFGILSYVLDTFIRRGSAYLVRWSERSQ